jgi:hypothetical protein
MNDAKYIGMDVRQATISAAVRDSSGNLVMEGSHARNESRNHPRYGARSLFVVAT